MIIRQENESDFEKVYNLVRESFVTAEHTDGNEHELLCPLRKSENFIPQLSLVNQTLPQRRSVIFLTIESSKPVDLLFFDLSAV